jgi:hypothetical protein
MITHKGFISKSVPGAEPKYALLPLGHRENVYGINARERKKNYIFLAN